MSGLTVGLMSISSLDLKIKLDSGSAQEKKYAKKVTRITHDHHLLLVTLLIANAVAMETLPIILDKIFSEYIAIALSVSFVLIFGEIVPQALCTGPNQLKIAYYMTPLVRIIVLIFIPLSYPIGKILDCCFGKDKNFRLKNDEIKALISLHASLYGPKKKIGLMKVQVKMIHGAIDLGNKLVKDHTIPIDKVYALSTETIINKKTFKKIIKQGFSRIPVYQGNNKNCIFGILLTKKLLGVEDNIPISEIAIKLREPLFVSPDYSLINLLEKFKEGKNHMAIVKDKKNKVIGIITLEDLIEEILKFEIYDEGDYDDQIKLITKSLIPSNDISPTEERTRSVSGMIGESFLPKN